MSGQVVQPTPAQVARLAAGLSAQQRNVLRALSSGRGYDALELAEFHASGSLAFRNRDRVLDALERKGLIEGERVTDVGRAALAATGSQP